jgi:hypothetical protein
MRFSKFKWAACLCLGALIGFAAAAHRSGWLHSVLRAQEPAVAQGGETQDKKKGKKGKGTPKVVPKDAAKLQPLESLPRPEARSGVRSTATPSPRSPTSQRKSRPPRAPLTSCSS